MIVVSDDLANSNFVNRNICAIGIVPGWRAAGLCATMSTMVGFAFSFTTACDSISDNVIPKLLVVISPYVTKDSGSAGYHTIPPPSPPHQSEDQCPRTWDRGLQGC